MILSLKHGLQGLAVVLALLVSDYVDPPSSEGTPPASAETPAQAAFDFSSVQRLARERASQPYRKPSESLPQELAHIDYDQYRDIRFRPARALWQGEAMFEVQFFHRGFNFKRPVNVFEVSDGNARPIGYDPQLFEFGPLTPPPQNLGPDIGFAGLRVHYPLHTPAHKDEVIVFLGASYFRFLGRNQGYGLSARGLAVNTASPGGEEFPDFTDFWLVKPAQGQRTLTIFALLDSPSVAGAYRFEVRPGGATQVEVTAELYPRSRIDKLGIAPLTSMFMFGEDPSGRRFDDFRPEVHDSDGLSAQTGAGEWLWRPLVNPRQLQVNRFLDDNPKGFGLMQRDRDFSHYQDSEARYHIRPSYWIEPLGNWSKGGLELVEIPASEEIHDNVVAYWVPAALVEAGKPLRFSYLVHSFSESHRWPPGGRAIATRTGSGAIIGQGNQSSPDETRRVVVDFTGGELDLLQPSQPVQAQVSATGGAIDDVTVQRLPDSGTWRATFRVAPKDSQVDLRCYLTLYGEALTETWTYLWTP